MLDYRLINYKPTITYNNDEYIDLLASTFSLLVNNNMTYNVAVGLTVTSVPHPNPGLG